MWPPSRPKIDPIQTAIDAGIGFAGEQWRLFCAASPLASNIHLRDRIAFFAGAFRPALAEKFPALASAPDQLVLLIIAKGIEESGTFSRAQIEKQLGIILPP